MIPLNIFLEQCSQERRLKASLINGSAILQLAQATIFPRDMMTEFWMNPTKKE